MDYDFVSAIVDEVALEGLDGITVSMLWIRLQNRPHFRIAIDNDSKQFLWEGVAMHRDIEVYELPTPRKLVPIYNRYEYTDSEFGMVLEMPKTIIDLYPIVIVNDGNNKGSCATYNSRKCITSEIRKDNVLLKPLDEIIQKWDEKLVLVASPKARCMSLTGSEIYPFEMSIEEYSLLERIGRSRYLGEVTQGSGGLLSLEAPFCKNLHYHRKKLTSRGLITKQFHYMKNNKDRAIVGSLFHLTKFYVPCKTKMETLMKSLCDILKEKPLKMELITVLREKLHLNASSFRKLLGRYVKFIRALTIPYKDFFPGATLKESLTLNGKDKMVTVVQLLKCSDELNDIENDCKEAEHVRQPLNVHFDCSKLYYNLPLICQVYKIIQDAGFEGISSSCIGRIITLPRLDVRSLLNTLTKRDLIISFLREEGKQKEIKYVAKNIFLENEVKVKKQKTIQKNSAAEELQKCKTLKRKLTQTLENADTFSNTKVKLKKSENNDDILQKHNLSNKDGTFKQINLQNTLPDVSELQDSDVFIEEIPKLISISEKIVYPVPGSKDQLTDRNCKRRKWVLDNLKSLGICNLSDLKKYLIDKEKKEGYNFKLDRKSVKRLVYRLCQEKELKIFVVVLGLSKKQRQYEFICDCSVEQSDSRILFAIEQEKFKIYNYASKVKSKSNNYKYAICHDNRKNLFDKRKIGETEEKSLLSAQKRISESQNYPKFLRFKAFHEFLFYLVYSYEGHSHNNSPKPIIYHNSMTWKRFVRPLPPNERKGWCYLANVYTRIPLSIFAKVFNLKDKGKQFVEYLEDEEKIHYPIIHLPPNLYGILLTYRKYLFDVVLKYLCYMGLITFGPQIAKEKDQVYLYIHKKASLKDTTISPPSYIHIKPELPYEKKIFPLNTLGDVERFWDELENVCLNTPLGKYNLMDEKTIIIAKAKHKPELIKASKNRNFDEISDVEHIPGDGLGAGGFDSVLYLHCKRNWQILKNISLPDLLKNKAKIVSGNHSRLNRLDKYHISSYKGETIKKTAGKKCKSTFSKSSVPSALPQKGTKIKYKNFKVPNEKRIHRKDYKQKEKGKSAVRRKSPYHWTPEEDSFLLLCKVTSLLLDPTSKSLLVDSHIIRDLMYGKFPRISRDKTAHACQKRIRLIMRNPTTANNVAVFLGEARLDKNLIKEFDGLKPSKTNRATSVELFTTVLKRLIEKFTLPAANRYRMVFLPNSIENFNETFEVKFPYVLQQKHHDNPKCEDEVKCSTLYSLIVSSMAIIKHKNEWSHLLYKLYQIYPETMLKSVVSHLQCQKVIAFRKKKNKNDLYCSSLSTFPCQFSMLYENIMLQKFPVRLFNESKELIDVLKYMNKDCFELKPDIAVGYAIAVLALALLNQLQLTVEIPKQIISLDTSLNADAYSAIICDINSLRDNESVKFSRLFHGEKHSSNIRKRKVQSFRNSTAKQLEGNMKVKLDSNTHLANKIYSNNTTRFALCVMRQQLSQLLYDKVQQSQDCIVLNPCKVFCNLKPNVDVQSLPNSTTINKKTFHLTKRLNKSIPKILTDSCVSEIKKSLTPFISSEAFSKRRNFYKCIENIYNTYSSQTINDAKIIFREIFNADVAGISEKSIWKKFRVLSGELSLFDHLHLFIGAVLVIRAGVASFVYVCICYAKSWFLPSYLMGINHKNEAKNCSSCSENTNDCKKFHLKDNNCDSLELLNKDDNNTFQIIYPENLENCIPIPNENLQNPVANVFREIYFLPKTWRYPNGTLNKETFMELLQTIVIYIIKSPGVNTLRVIDHFSLPLQPAQTLELLEILEKAYCIEKYYCKKLPKKKLFSSSVDIIITKNPDPDDLDHLESLPNAISNLAKLQKAMV